MKEGAASNHGFSLAKRKNLPLISRSKEEDEEYLNSFPSGYRFKPQDFELVGYYLKRKVYNEPLPPNRIRDVQLYSYDPETLTAISENKSSNGVVTEWYFFTPRDRKYRNGKRPGRKAGNGFWKATGADKHIKYKGNLLGFKKTLVFYMGKPPKGVKTNWIMHEFVLNNPPARERNGDNVMRLDDWVLCRVYKKEDAKSKRENSHQGTDHKQEEAEDAISAHTETWKQEYGIPPPQSEQFRAKDFNMLSQQTFPMPFYNAYDDSTSGGLPKFPEVYYDPALKYDFTTFHEQPVSDYGNFISTAAPISSVPPDQLYWMGHDNLNIYQQPQQPLNFQFSAADQFLLNTDFGLPKV